MTEQFRALLAVLRGSWADWNSVRLADLQFAQAGTARMAVAAIIGVTVAVLVLRTMARASAYRGRVALPALASFTNCTVPPPATLNRRLPPLMTMPAPVNLIESLVATE